MLDDNNVNNILIRSEVYVIMRGEQIRAARALLKWSGRRLSESSGVSYPTIQRLESQDGPIGGLAETGAKIRAALESAGVEFIQENGGGAGVRLRKP